MGYQYGCLDLQATYTASNVADDLAALGVTVPDLKVQAMEKVHPMETETGTN